MLLISSRTLRRHYHAAAVDATPANPDAEFSINVRNRAVSVDAPPHPGVLTACAPSGAMHMILNNTIVGLAAGVGLMLFARLLKHLVAGEKISAEGFSLAFGITGFILTVMGLVITVTWPYRLVLHANVMMGEPALAFGVTLAAASFYTWSRRDLFAALGERSREGESLNAITAVMQPVAVWIFALGLMMASLAVAILYYRLGAAPPQEPISGLLTNTRVESVFLGLLWGLTAAGALLFPAAIKNWHRTTLAAVRLCWMISGALFLLFSALNFFTHIGLLLHTSF
jgi:hypothetical protein